MRKARWIPLALAAVACGGCISTLCERGSIRITDNGGKMVLKAYCVNLERTDDDRGVCYNWSDTAGRKYQIIPLRTDQVEVAGVLEFGETEKR